MSASPLVEVINYPQVIARAIADEMNEANVPAPRAGRWNPMTVSLILKREREGRG